MSSKDGTVREFVASFLGSVDICQQHELFDHRVRFTGFTYNISRDLAQHIMQTLRMTRDT